MIPNRWKLNSIRYGPRLLTLIAVLTLAVPLGLYLCVTLLRLSDMWVAALRLAIFLSVAAGAGLLVVFMALLAIEFAQDRWLDNYYHHLQNRKIRIAEGYYECPYCGYQKVRDFDKVCTACGKDLV